MESCTVANPPQQPLRNNAQAMLTTHSGAESISSQRFQQSARAIGTRENARNSRSLDGICQRLDWGGEVRRIRLWGSPLERRRHFGRLTSTPLLLNFCDFKTSCTGRKLPRSTGSMLVSHRSFQCLWGRLSITIRLSVL